MAFSSLFYYDSVFLDWIPATVVFDVRVRFGSTEGCKAFTMMVLDGLGTGGVDWKSRLKWALNLQNQKKGEFFPSSPVPSTLQLVRLDW